jgi:hypothetical protein
MDIIGVFGSEPAFKLGDHVYLRYQYERTSGEVVYCKDYCMVSGINFCSEYSGYVGWNYEIQVYKEVSYSSVLRKVSIYPNLLYGNANEIDLYLCYKTLKFEKIVNSLKLKQLEYVRKNPQI